MKVWTTKVHTVDNMNIRMTQVQARAVYWHNLLTGYCIITV